VAWHCHDEATSVQQAPVVSFDVVHEVLENRTAVIVSTTNHQTRNSLKTSEHFTKKKKLFSVFVEQQSYYSVWEKDTLAVTLLKNHI
jgi:hypothetical protein